MEIRIIPAVCGACCCVAVQAVWVNPERFNHSLRGRVSAFADAAFLFRRRLKTTTIADTHSRCNELRSYHLPPPRHRLAAERLLLSPLTRTTPHKQDVERRNRECAGPTLFPMSQSFDRQVIFAYFLWRHRDFLCKAVSILRRSTACDFNDRARADCGRHASAAPSRTQPARRSRAQP